MLIPTLAILARGGPSGAGILFLLFLLLAVGLLGGLAAWLIGRRGGGAGRRSALDALEERFVRGEIDRAEFEHRRAVLTGADTVPPMAGAAGAEE